MRVFGYLQLSVEEANTKSQRFLMRQYFQSNGIDDDGITEEEIPGTVGAAKRMKLQYLMERLRASDYLFITAIERLGGSRQDALDVFISLRDKDIIVGILNVPGMNDWHVLQTVLQYNMLSRLFVHEEQQTIRLLKQYRSEATKEGMNKAVTRGKRPGHPAREHAPDNFVRDYESYKFGSYMGLSHRQLCRHLGMSRATYYKYEKLIQKDLESGYLIEVNNHFIKSSEQ